MTTLAQNINISLSELIKSNYQKIKVTTPVNPSISKDDEWKKDTEWDNFSLIADLDYKTV